MERTNKRQIATWMMVAILVLALAVIAAVGLNVPTLKVSAEEMQGLSDYPIVQVTPEMVPNNPERPTADIFPCFTPISYDKIKSWDFSTDEVIHLIFDFDEDGFYYGLYIDGTWRENPIHETYSDNSTLQSTVRDESYYYTANGGPARVGGRYLIGSKIIFETEAQIRYERIGTTTATINPGEYTVVTPEYDPDYQCYIFPGQFAINDISIDFSLFDRMRVIGNTFPVIGFTCISGDGSSSPYEFKLLYDEEESGQGDEQSSSVVRVGETDYPSLSDAFEASDAGDVLVLLDDIDVSDQPNYITVDKSITIDLNGHTLNVGNSYETPAIVVGDNDKTNGSVVLSVINSVPADGGILGFCYVGQDDSYILFSDCRLSFTVEEVEATSDINKIATGYEAVEIESTDPTYASGFRSVIRPEQHTHDDITFTPWESATSLPTVAGSYYLTADVTLTSTWEVPNGVTNLCLNGYGIILGSYRIITVRNSGATLNLYDCGSTVHYYDVDAEGMATNVNDVAGEDRQSFIGGYITGGVYGGGGAIWVENATFNMYGGTILGNSASLGGGVYVSESTGTINLHGGKIMHNKATRASEGGGGGVYLAYGATLNMYGGEISYNYTASDGGGVAFPSGTFRLFGGAIAHNVAAGNGGGIYKHTSSRKMYLSGAPVVEDNTAGGAGNDLYINVAGDVLNISGDLTQGATIGVALSGGTGVFTSGWSDYMEGADPADYLYSENAAYQVYLFEGEAAILAEAPAVPHIHDGVTFTAWESTNSLPTEAGNYYLTADVTLSSTWMVPTGTTNLCLNGHVIAAASGKFISVITVQNGATLNLYDCDTTEHYYYVDEDPDVQNRADNNDEMYDIGEIAADGPTDPAYVASTKKGTFKGGYITGGTGQGLTSNSRNISGGGFQIYGGGTLNMYGGCIFGNYTSATSSEGNDGGGVYIYENGVFNMNGGYIIGNQGGNCGGAVENHGTFTMNDGYIRHNTAGDGGWAVGGGINNAGTMTMNGGVIEGNEAGGHGGLRGKIGGGINNGGSLTINGGCVINNFSDNVGGGIYTTVSLTIGAGAKITGNYNDETKKADNIYLETDKMITLGSALTEKNSVGVTMKGGTGVFTTGWNTYMTDADPAEYFFSDDESYGVYLKGGEAAILEEAPPIPVSLGEGKLYVGGEDIVKADSYTVSGNGGGSAVYSEDEQGNRFLTLTDYVYTGPGYSGGGEGGGIDYRGGGTLTILLVGNSSITKADDSGIGRSHGIYLDNGTLIIDGTGSLTIGFADDRGGWKSNGIFNESGSFVMNGGTVVSNAGVGDESAGIYAGGGITFNGGNFTGNGNYTTDYESRGIYSSSITINGGTVCGTAPLDNNFEARAFDGSVTINAGTLTAYGKVSFSWGVQCGANSTWTILAGDDEASATQVGGVDGNEKYVHISASTHVHNYSEDWSSDDTYHWHDCLNADCNVPEGSKAAHVYGDDISETTYYVCSVCEYENKDRKDEYEIYQTYGPVTKYELYIAGSQVTSAALSGDGWSYDPETNTLTLNNFTYEGEGADNSKLWRFNSVVTYAGEEPFSLILVGENSITNTKDNYDYIMALLSIADLSISGNGSLTLSAPNAASTMSMGLYVDADLYVNGGEITAIGGRSEWRSAGICVSGMRFVQKGGSVFAQGGLSDDDESYGLYALGVPQTSSADANDSGEMSGGDIVDGITIGASVKSFIADGHTSALYTKGMIDFKRGYTAWLSSDSSSDGTKFSAGEYENTTLADYKHIEIGEDSLWVIKMKVKPAVPSSYTAYIGEDETIVRVYDVSLYRIAIAGGEKQEPVPAQPSDIAAGTTITVKLSIPDALLGKDFTILHVHAADDYSFVVFEREENEKCVLIRGVDRLSDFAFVAKKADLNSSVPVNPVNPVDPADPSGPEGGQPLDIEPEVTQEDDPALENWTLTPQGGQTEPEEGEEVNNKKPAVTVSLEDTEAQEGVSVEVEVKTEISEEVQLSEKNVLNQVLQSDDEIAIVYDVKLIRTMIENGVEIREEIQPSDIKPGTIISIDMTIPEGLRGKPFKLLHIHSDDDIKEIASYSISEDGNSLTVRVNRLSEFAFVGKLLAGDNVDGDKKSGPNKIPDGAIAGIVIGASFGVLLLGFLIFLLLKKGKKNGEDNDGVSDKQKKKVILAAPITEKKENVGFYRITTDVDGKCTFALLYEAEDHLSKEMGVFDNEKAAREAIRVLRAKGDGAKAENRVRPSGESIPAPKFVLDVDGKGVYRYFFLDEDGSVLLQSVQYLNEERCLQDLKLTLVCITTDTIVGQNGEISYDEIAASAPVAEKEKTSVEAVEELPVEEKDGDTAEETVEAPAEKAVSLKENIITARATLSHSKIDKKHIAEYLKNKYGDCVRLNCRVNETKTGLPLADTHYTVNDQKNICFVYVYEVGETVMLLVKVDEAYGKSLAKKHPIVKRSAFPKAKYAWYSVIVDDSFREEEVEEIIDAAYLYCGGKACEALSLKESLAAAEAIETDAERTKKGIADFLTEKFGAGVRINSRANRTRTKRPLADTHYAIKDEKRACFVYVYEVGTVVLLVRLPEAFAEKLMQKHATVKRSAFPKAKYAWYSVILDDSFTDAEVHEVLVTAHDAVLD